MFGDRNTLRVLQVAVVAILISAVPAAAGDQPTAQATYNATVDRVYAAELKAFGVPPVSSVKDQCVVHYKTTSGASLQLWTATCKDEGKGKVGVNLQVKGPWIFGIGTERKRIARVFWGNMDLILNNTAPSGAAAPTSSPQAPQPTPPQATTPQPKPPEATPSEPTPSQPTPPQAAPAQQTPQPAAETPATLKITSSPKGADIMIDGDYEGSTPTKLKLASGKHAVKIIKNGFQPWEQSITVRYGESRNIDAKMHK